MRGFRDLFSVEDLLNAFVYQRTLTAVIRVSSDEMREICLKMYRNLLKKSKKISLSNCCWKADFSRFGKHTIFSIQHLPLRYFTTVLVTLIKKSSIFTRT